MARVTRVEIVDDLDGTPLGDNDAVTIDFTVNGTSYTLDVSDSNAKKFHEALAPFVSAATQVSSTRTAAGRGRRGRSNASGSSLTKEQLADIREWARANGIEVADRGRIKGDVIERYNAAH